MIDQRRKGIIVADGLCPIVPGKGFSGFFALHGMGHRVLQGIELIIRPFRNLQILVHVVVFPWDKIGVMRAPFIVPDKEWLLLLDGVLDQQDGMFCQEIGHTRFHRAFQYAIFGWIPLAFATRQHRVFPAIPAQIVLILLVSESAAAMTVEILANESDILGKCRTVFIAAHSSPLNGGN